MSYGELSLDTNNEIVLKRIDIENKIKSCENEFKEVEITYNKSKSKLSNAKNELKSEQRKCKHINASLYSGFQGGGIYYCKCFCPECGKTGDRYVPQYHMINNNEWYKKEPDKCIDLETAIKIGEDIGNKTFNNEYWWGPVQNYDHSKVLKYTY